MSSLPLKDIIYNAVNSALSKAVQSISPKQELIDPTAPAKTVAPQTTPTPTYTPQVQDRINKVRSMSDQEMIGKTLNMNKSSPDFMTFITPTPAQTQTQLSSGDPKIRQVIAKVLSDYGAPAATLSAQFADAAAQNDLLKDNPYLLPAVSILETSGGKRESAPNNPINWGIHAQQQGLFNPASPGETISKAASGISYRTPSVGYDKFRKSKNINDFVEAYAPPGENNTEKYKKDLLTVIQRFKDYEKEVSSKK